MTQSWTVHMGDYPVDIEKARVLAAKFEGMSMVAASDGFPNVYTIMVEADGGTCPVEVKPGAFAEIAITVARTKVAPIVVLSRTDPGYLFSFDQFCDADAVAAVTARLGADL